MSLSPSERLKLERPEVTPKPGWTYIPDELVERFKDMTADERMGATTEIVEIQHARRAREAKA